MPLLTLLADRGGSSVLRFDDGLASLSLKRLLATRLGADVNAFYLTRNGRSLQGDDTFQDGDLVRIQARLVGGKGGFGSMLRALGAQIEKTTNHEAMRDLSGRRVRDVNNEKALTSWLSKTSERQRQREERRKERMDRKKAQLETPKHKFTDASYDQQKSQVLENLDDALEAGLKKRNNGEGEIVAKATLKRKSDEEEEGASATKKLFGMGDMDSGSSTEESEEEEAEGEDEGKEARKAEPEDQRARVKDISSDEVEEKRAEVIPSSEEGSGNGVCQREDSPSDESSESTEPSEVLEGVQDEETTEPLDTPTPQSDVTPPQSEATPPPPPPLPLELTNYSSTSELEALGLDTLKAALTAIGLKCGGTLEERAARLWSVRGIDEALWDKSLLAKGKGKGKNKLA